MNPGNEPSTSGSEPQARPGERTPLKLEEMKIFKECCTGLYYKVGLPYAVCCEVFFTYFSKRPAVEETMQQILLKRGLRFLGNMFLGRLLAVGICYNKVATKRAELKENIGNLESQGIMKLETQAKDFDYSTNPVTNFRDLEGSFSSDYDTSKLLPDDLEGLKVPGTTYQDLRAQHRSSYRRNKEPSFVLGEEPRELGTNSLSFEKPFLNESPPPPSQKIIRKNKYGDEIE